MRIDITEKNMVWLVEHKMADTIVAEFHRKETVIESLIRERDEARAELITLRASSFVTAVPVEEYEKLKAEVEVQNQRIDQRDEDVGRLYCENSRLKAEVERLTIQRAKLIESAEKLFRFVGQELYGPIDHFEAAWEDAKEGKPSV